jgi:hypothetical protein
MSGRGLTYDEKKAAEAAFRGLPLDPTWSASARAVYDGILSASQGNIVVGEPEATDTIQAERHTPTSMGEPALPSAVEPTGGEATSEPAPEPSAGTGGLPGAMNREEAIQVGLLVDVTPLAREIGLHLPVGFTKPLWDTGITAGQQIPEGQHRGRVRDVLIALRLFLERAPFTAPVMEFPALLSFPPESVPQVCSLFVLAHKDVSTPYSLTLLLPREAAFIRLSSNN